MKNLNPPFNNHHMYAMYSTLYTCMMNINAHGLNIFNITGVKRTHQLLRSFVHWNSSSLP